MTRNCFKFTTCYDVLRHESSFQRQSAPGLLKAEAPPGLHSGSRATPPRISRTCKKRWDRISDETYVIPYEDAKQLSNDAQISISTSCGTSYKQGMKHGQCISMWMQQIRTHSPDTCFKGRWCQLAAKQEFWTSEKRQSADCHRSGNCRKSLPSMPVRIFS